MVSLSQAFRMTGSQAVALVGSGGKTSALFQLAGEQAPSIVTTTTHLGAWQVDQASQHYIWLPNEPIPDIEHGLRGSILLTGNLDAPTRRYRGLTPTQLEQLHQFCGFHDIPLLIEADGSQQRPLKAPAANEPLIPGFVDLVIVVAGLSGLYRPSNSEAVHRPEIFSALSELPPGDPILPDSLARVLSHAHGGLKNIPSSSRRAVLLNQADTLFLQSAANQVAGLLAPQYDSVIIASLQPSPPRIYAILENIAGIILATDNPTCNDTPGHLLDFHGQPFIRVVAKSALAAGLSPVIVVTGPAAEDASAAVADLDVRLIHNPEWLQDKGSSLRLGISSVPQTSAGAILLPAGQPQVSVELLRALIERHSQDIPAVLTPYVFDERSHPYLFDRITFNALVNAGDAGYRAVFSKFSPRFQNWYDRRLLLRAETPEKYLQMLSADLND